MQRHDFRRTVSSKPAAPDRTPRDSAAFHQSARLTARFEIILEDIADRRLRNIVQAYYGLGHSEERIAEEVGLSQTHVNRLRKEFIEKIDG